MTLTLTPAQHHALRECVELQIERHVALANVMASDRRPEPDSNWQARVDLTAIKTKLEREVEN